MKKTKKIKEKRCPKCNTLQPEDSIYERRNPYQYEINDIEVIEEMCNQCEDDSRMDI